MKFVKLTVIAGILLTSTTAFSTPEKLRVVGSWNSLSLYKNLESPLWEEVIPKEMGCKVDMTSLSQIGLKGAAVVRQMKMGVFDVVNIVADYIVSDSPNLAGLDLPGITTDLETARKTVEAYRPALEKYLANDFDVKLLSVVPYPAQVLFSRIPLASLDDLKDKKIRVSGWTTSEFVKAIGATGVTLSFSEVPQALQRGVVDAAITGSLSGYSAGWGEVSNYLYPLPMGGWDYVISVISMNTWDKFSKEEQQKLLSLVKEKLEEPGWAIAAKETQEGVDCLTGGKCPHGKAASMKLIPVTEDDTKRVKEVLVEDVLPALGKKVSPDAIKTWHETIGKAAGIPAKQ